VIATRASRTFLSGDVLRIWINPGSPVNIIVLVRGTLYLSSIAPKDLNQAAGMLSAGASPEQIFGSYHRAIPLVSISKVEADLRHNTFLVVYQSSLSSAKAEFEMASRTEADELVDVLRQQLGESYNEGKIRVDVINVCGLPLIVLLLHTALCYFAWMLTTPRNGVMHRTSPVERWLQDGPGEMGVLYFGAAIAGLLLLWMVFRFFGRRSGVVFTKS